MDLRSNLTADSGRAVNGLLLRFVRTALALLVYELERLKLRIVEMVKNREHFTFDDLRYLAFDLTLKNNQSTF